MIRSLARKHPVRRSLSLALTLLFTVAFLPPPPAALRAAAQESEQAQIPVIAPGWAYRQTNLVTDVPGLAPVLDPLLVNPWGISLTGTSPFWVANNGTSTSTLYRGDVGAAPLAHPTPPGLRSITIPPTPPPPPGSLPTGTVANTVNTEFVLPGACASAPCGANFLFATLTGKIMGWDPNAPAANSTTAVEAASQANTVYTGLALANNGSANFLYAADFRNGKIDVYNTSFVLQPAASFPFADPTIPATVGNDFHPYNIQAVGNSLYVAYAKVSAGGGPPEDGVGNGYVRKFDANGALVPAFAINQGQLNSPWGITVAPASFGIFGGALLVGNFGEGNPSIHAYDPTTGAPVVPTDAPDNALRDESGNGIVIDRLWDLKFGNGSGGGDVNTLYFAAGIGEERHGLFGKLNPTTASATSLIQFADTEFSIGEGLGHIDVTVTRTGDVSGTATVNYNTFDYFQAPPASPTPTPTPEPLATQKSDYEIALGTLRFEPGETSKTFRLLLVNDAFDEADEAIDLQLSNPTGAGVGLGSPNTAVVRVLDNDTGAPASNPIDDPAFFVRQHYLDFLNREPDAAGQSFWQNEITSCATNTACIENKRVNVSAAFFLSIEFQRTGYLAYLTHRAAFGANAPGSPAPVLYGNFMRDVQALQRGFVFGQPGADAVLEANKVAYFNDFVTRPEFVAKYPSTLTNEQYVDNLLGSAGLSPSQVRLFVVNLTNDQENPPVTPTLTTGGARPTSFGTARFQFNDAQTALTFTANITNIDVTGSQTSDTNDNLTAAHIHAGPNAPPANNPVVWGFFGAPFNDNNPNDQVFFPSGAVGGTFSGKWDAPEGNNTTLAAQLENLRAGRAYINFHTRQFPGGEIRGNFPAANAFRDQLVAGLNGSTLTRATVLRAVAEAAELQSREFNSAFVAMQYFGYLRRDPDTAGFNFWRDKLNAFNGNFQNAEMVKAFINSLEYRQRFGPS